MKYKIIALHSSDAWYISRKNLIGKTLCAAPAPFRKCTFDVGTAGFVSADGTIRGVFYNFYAVKLQEIKKKPTRTVRAESYSKVSRSKAKTAARKTHTKKVKKK